MDLSIFPPIFDCTSMVQWLQWANFVININVTENRAKFWCHSSLQDTSLLYVFSVVRPPSPLSSHRALNIRSFSHLCFLWLFPPKVNVMRTLSFVLPTSTLFYTCDVQGHRDLRMKGFHRRDTYTWKKTTVLRTHCKIAVAATYFFRKRRAFAV